MAYRWSPSYFWRLRVAFAGRFFQAFGHLCGIDCAGVFHAAYVAEDIRSGLQSIPRGQWEACQSLGLSHWQTLRLVILPQALKAATPALTNTAIGGFKDTSLIVLVGLHDMVSTARMAFSDVNWQAQALEAYVFVGLVFLCSMA